jgi:enoyl-CoA hydratase/carnithine racemase
MSAVPQAEQPILVRGTVMAVCSLTMNRAADDLLTSEMLARCKKPSMIPQATEIAVVVLAGMREGLLRGHDLKEISALKELPKIEALFNQCSRMMQTIPDAAAAGDRDSAGRRGRPPAASSSRSATWRSPRSAKFVTSGVNWGFFCSTPGVAVGRNLSRKHAMEMLLTGERSARKGARVGPVN